MKICLKQIMGMAFIFSVCFASPLAFSHDYSHEKAEYLKNHPLRDMERQSGVETVRYMNEDYGTINQSCDEPSEPSFLCSGIILRGTDVFSTAYHAWDPSPKSVTSGGISFSYLRADSKFDKLAYSYNNGFTFYPYFYAPDGSGVDTNIDILCSFPIDAGTSARTDKGCGASSRSSEGSGPCQDQGITTAQQWYDHYIEGNHSHDYQCGFITDDDSSYDTADAFYQTLLSMNMIASESIQTQNELRLETWAQGKQDSLPIQSFFYIAGSSAGLDSAQKNQQDFYNSTTENIWVPVIQITLPATESADAVFKYKPGDQLIPEPAALNK